MKETIKPCHPEQIPVRRSDLRKGLGVFNRIVEQQPLLGMLLSALLFLAAAAILIGWIDVTGFRCCIEARRGFLALMFAVTALYIGTM